MTDIFKNLAQVLAYLKRLNLYKISKPTIYRHFEQGKILSQKDGTFLISDVDRYAKNWLKLSDGSQIGRNRTGVGLGERQSAEARKVAAQADHWELKTKIMSGEYVERAAFERALAQRAMIFKTDIENFFRNYAGEFIALVGGDATRAPDLIDFCLNQAEKWLARYSENKEFALPAAVDLSKLAKLGD